VTAALSGHEVAALLAPVAASPSIALAVSGGRDSLALLAAVDAWRGEAGRPAVHVLTVDHRLGAGSAAVAEAVAALAREQGLPARVLAWEGDKPAGGIEAAARLARYRLLAAAAAEAGAGHLLTAHSLEDQAETFVLRLSRGSGPFGLAAMRPRIDLDGVVLFRPFLAVPRARLAATAAAAGLVPHDDPMNADPRFERVRIRRLLPALAAAGLTAEVLAMTAARCADLAAGIDAAVDALVAGAVAVDAFAVVTVRRDAFAAAPAPVRERLLVRLLRAIGGGGYPPRSERLAALDAALAAPDACRLRRTLAGTVVEAGPVSIRLWRETGRRGLPVVAAPPGGIVVWDGRYRVAIPPGAPPGLTLGALGGARPAVPGRPAGLPAGAAAALPAVFAGPRLVAIPPLRWSAEGSAADGVAAAECVSESILRPAPFPPLAAGG
jgi:tRNA(Ile)-lysidine synthase